jgi:uncharacterized protein YqeY
MGAAAAGGGSYAEASYVAAGAWVPNGDAPAAPTAVSSGFSALPWGASVRCRAARTLCSIWDRRAEYMERLSTDFRRSTKKIAPMPIRAANGPMARAQGIRRRLSAIGPFETIAAVALYDRIQAELVESRRRRDSVTLDTLSLLKSELVKASKETAAGGTIDDELVVRLARKEVKRREEAIDVYRKAGRADSARREEAEMEVLKSFLPATMSEEDVEAEVAAVIAELKPEGPKAFGLVMKGATARLAGRAEGAQVAAAARKLLGT